MLKKFSGALVAATLLSGVALPVSIAQAQATFAAPQTGEGGNVNFSAATRGAPILSGSEVVVSGRGFQAGQTVTLLYGTTTLTASPLVASAEGTLEGRFTLPANAAVGTHSIVVVTNAPYAAKIAELKVSPNIPLSGQNNYTIQRAVVTQGLYQSAYSARNNAVFVTSSVGRPPVSQSELVRLNATTLAIEARVTPAAAPAREGRPGPGGPGRPAGQPQAPGVFAVYGVGVDDANGNVWVTNTRQNTVAVYRQSDLTLVRQFAPDTVNHARDIVVDTGLNKAFSSATMTPEVVVFNTQNPDVAERISINSNVRGEKFSTASLSLDATNHRLYVISLSTNEVAVINTRTNAVEHVFAVPGARGAIGVSHDPQTGRIFVASQGSDNLVILDGTTGAVVADTPVGAGSLNVVFDPSSRRAFVANRGASTITVTDVDGRIVANLGPAPQVNHVSTDGRGDVFAVTKGAAEQEDANSLWRIHVRR